MTSHLLRLWVIGSYEMPRCDWLQHCNFLAGIEILPIALQTACKPCGFAAGKPAIVAGPVLRVAIGESCSVCRALKVSPARELDTGTALRFPWHYTSGHHHCGLAVRCPLQESWVQSPLSFSWHYRSSKVSAAREIWIQAPLSAFLGTTPVIGVPCEGAGYRDCSPLSLALHQWSSPLWLSSKVSTAKELGTESAQLFLALPQQQGVRCKRAGYRGRSLLSPTLHQR